MLDAILFIAFWNCTLFGLESVIVLPGLPFAFAIFGCMYFLNAFPEKTYLHDQPLLLEIIALTILVDFIQFNLHLLEHKLHFKSHSIHHRKTTPSCCDAFHTGIFDAALQLVLPIYIAICVVDPNKTSLITFGCFYAYWLQWIHSNSPYALSIKSSFFVTPSYHRIHHQQPTKNLSHVFILWDQLLRLVV